MPALIRFLVELTFRGVIASVVFVLTLFRRVHIRIQPMNNMDNTIPGSRLNPVSSSSTSYRTIGNNPSQNMTTTPLAIENVQDTASAHESIEKNENALRNEGQMDSHDESFHQVAGNANENQSRNAPNSSIIVVNTNDENVQPENPNNADEMIVAALAFVLECCDMCVIL